MTQDRLILSGLTEEQLNSNTRLQPHLGGQVPARCRCCLCKRVIGSKSARVRLATENPELITEDLTLRPIGIDDPFGGERLIHHLCEGGRHLVESPWTKSWMEAQNDNNHQT